MKLSPLVLEALSSVQGSSSYRSKFEQLLSSALSVGSELDRWFGDGFSDVLNRKANIEGEHPSVLCVDEDAEITMGELKYSNITYLLYKFYFVTASDLWGVFVIFRFRIVQRNRGPSLFRDVFECLL